MGDYITTDMVKKSTSKKLVIMSAGSEKEYEGKRKPQFLVEFEGKRLNWTLNKQTVTNLIESFGPDSNQWIGRIVYLTISISHNNKEMIIGKGVIPSSF
jgi:hypothetical protein